MSAIELINLYDERVNKPKRKKVLDGILNHSSGNILAKCVFERLDSSHFLAARNLLIPKNDGDEYGPYDSILEPVYCKSILRSLGTTDYVIKLLRDEFNRKYERDVDSLSDIARIVTEREEISNETAIPKVILKMDENYPRVKIGSEWIISDTMINGWEACNRYDEPQTDGLELYVYKISRSSGILLKQIQLPLSFIGHPSLLLEPFLIMFDGHDSWEVHNLLEPNKAPMTIKRSQWIIGDIDFVGLWAGSKYESDIRQNGKLPESILFPVIYQPSARIVCVDCIDIRQSEIRTLWTQTVEFNNKIELDVIFIDRDNILLLAQLYEDDEFFFEPQIYQSQVYHVVLSKEKITKYTFKDKIGPDNLRSVSFGIYEEMVVMYGCLDNIVPITWYPFGFLSLTEGCNDFKPVCLLVKPSHSDITICREAMLYFYDLGIEDRQIKRISTRRILDFINDESQEKLNVETFFLLKEVTLPVVDLSQFETTDTRAQEDFEIRDRSRIGRASRNKIELFI